MRGTKGPTLAHRAPFDAAQDRWGTRRKGRSGSGGIRLGRYGGCHKSNWCVCLLIALASRDMAEQLGRSLEPVDGEFDLQK